MYKAILLCGVAILALTAASVGATPRSGHTVDAANNRVAGGDILYNQNHDYGYSVISQNFASESVDNAAAADDFMVPKGKIWNVTGVDVAGEYFVGTGPASSEIITFYKTDHGRPGKVMGAPQTLTCTDTAGNFACTIKTVHLSGGTKGKRYWLSVVANCDSACGEWGWIQNTATHHDPGQWENPGGGLGFGCTSWNDTSSCITLSGVVDDFAFDLRGKSN